jgi:hypothetical protein
VGTPSAGAGTTVDQHVGTKAWTWSIGSALRSLPFATPDGRGDLRLLPAAVLTAEVTATWAVGGTRMTSFDRPLDIVLTNTTGSTLVPAT